MTPGPEWLSMTRAAEGPPRASTRLRRIFAFVAGALLWICGLAKNHLLVEIEVRELVRQYGADLRLHFDGRAEDEHRAHIDIPRVPLRDLWLGWQVLQ